MKKLIILALLFAIGFFGFGCFEQPQTNATITTTIQTTNQTASVPTIVVFYEPANNGLEQKLFERVSAHLPDAKIDYRCVDFTKILYGQVSQSENICKQKEGARYDENMALFESLLNKNYSAIVYVSNNGNYVPVQTSLHPLVMAKNICNAYQYKSCTSLPELKQLKTVLYAKKTDDAVYFNQVLQTLQQVGFSLGDEQKTVDDSVIADLKKQAPVNFLPVLKIENASEDDQFVLDLFFSNLGASSSYGTKKDNSNYLVFVKAGNMENYIGDAPLIEGVAYVPAGKESTYTGIFDGLGIAGIYVNASYVGLNSTAANALGNETGLSYLPILIIDSAKLNADQKSALDNAVGKAIPMGSIDLYVKNAGSKYYVYTSLSSQELYIGQKLDKVVIDLYVMSHCPFGLQMQKAFVPVIEAFNSSGRLIVHNKFVDYTMHGDEETKDNLYEYCVDQKAPEKTWSFIRCFAENNGDEVQCMQKLNIDKNVIDACVAETKTKFNFAGASFPIYESENSLYGVQGSPTVVFMGKQLNLARNPEAIKEFVCSMLSEPLPAACNMTFSSESAAPGFGPINGTTSSSTSASCG